MTTDAEYIQSVVDEGRERGGNFLHIQADVLVGMMERDANLRELIARHLLERDPQCVRIPLVGEVS